MPEYVIHVGPYKTGSSYLQAGLAENAATLEAAGIHVASAWSDHALNPSQSGLVSGLTEAGLSALRPVFEAWERSSYSRVVVSCEELSTLSPGQVQMLRGLTNGAPVSIVFYVRRWPELLASEWQEYVKQGKTLQLPEVIVHNLRNPERSRIINPDLFLKPYEAVFGRAALKLIPYSVITDCGGDIFDEFAKHFLQPAMVARPRQRMVNPSFPAPKIELLRLFNCLDQEAGVNHTRRMLRFLELQHSPLPVTKMIDFLNIFAKTIVLADDDAAARDVALANNMAYRGCSVLPLPYGGLYSSRATTLVFIRPDYGLTPGFAETLRQLRLDLLAVDGVG